MADCFAWPSEATHSKRTFAPEGSLGVQLGVIGLSGRVRVRVSCFLYLSFPASLDLQTTFHVSGVFAFVKTRAVNGS